MADKVLADIGGRSIAITGANRGIGRALALALARRGTRLTLHARDAAKASEVAREAEEAGAAAVATAAGDLRDPALGARIVAAAREAHGGLDGLVLNAAVLGPMRPLHEVDPEAFAEVMRVNVDAQHALYCAALPALREGGGVLVWLSSGLGRFGLAEYGAYCASKHAVEGLMRVAAEELAGTGLVTATVAPGMVQTEMLRAAMKGGDISGFQSPEETGEAFARLLADLGPDHHGQSLDLAPWL